jgi:signal transduction histidine kinase
MKKLLFVYPLLFLFYFNSSVSLARIPDSLLVKLKTFEHDTSKIKYLNDYADFTYYENPTLALEVLDYSESLCKNRKWDNYYADVFMMNLIILPAIGEFKEAENYGLKGLKYSKEKNMNPEIADFQFNYGTLKYQQRQYDSAIYYFNDAIKTNTKTKDTLRLAKIYFNLSNVYEDNGQLDDALRALQISLKHNKSLKRTVGISNCYNSIGLLFIDQNKFIESIKYFDLSFKMRLKEGDSLRASVPLTNIASSYQSLNNYPKAYEKLKLAIQIKEKYNHKRSLLDAYMNFANLYYKMDSIQQAHIYYDKVLMLAEEMNSDYHKYLATLNLVPLWTDQKNYSFLIEQLNGCRKYFEEIGSISDLKTTHESLYKSFLDLKDYKNAFFHLHAYDSLRFILHNQEASRNLEEFNVKYETSIKDLEIEELKVKNVRSQLNIQKHKSRNIFLIGLISFLSVLSILFFALFRSKQKRKILETSIDVENAERKRIARDMHDELGSGLSKMAIISQLMEKKMLNPEEIEKYGKSVKETSAKLMENMSSLVWSLNPEHQSTEAFIAKLKEYFSSYLESVNLEWEFIVTGKQTKGFQFGRDLVKNIYPACKESVNNAVKHSQANKIGIEISFSGKFVHFRVYDNGKGFNVIKTGGHGLKNLESRIKMCKGDLEIQTEIGKGTEIRFKNIPMELNNTYEN